MHNAQGTAGTKVELRRHVLEHVRPVHVLDAFCGPDGLMWEQTWREAASYAGIDLEWKPTDPRRRFVGDNKKILRALDLQAFNVFDLDAFGSPWELMVILAARRTWAPGERGAVVLTDAGAAHGQFGQASGGIAELLGLPPRGLAPGNDGARERNRMTLRAWVRRCNVTPLHAWELDSAPRDRGAAGSFRVAYTAIVFEGSAKSGSDRRASAPFATGSACS